MATKPTAHTRLAGRATTGCDREVLTMLDPHQPIAADSSDGVVTDQQWIRLGLPGLGDDQLRLAEARSQVLAGPLAEILGSSPIDAIEVLTCDGEHQEEYLLSPAPPGDAPVEAGQLTAAAATQGFDALLEAGVEPAIAALGLELDARLPDLIGVSVVDVDLEPVGATPLGTTRMVATTSDPIALEGTEAAHSLATAIAECATEDTSHLARTRVARTDEGSYLLEQQFAVVDGRNQALYPEERGDILTTSLTPALGTDERAGISTSRQILAERNWRARSLTEGPPVAHGTMPAAADGTPPADVRRTIRALLDDDYARLVGRQHKPGRLRAAYETLGVTPTIQLPDSAASLGAALGLVPQYHCGRWHAVDKRASPSIDSQVVVSEPAGLPADLQSMGTPPANGYDEPLSTPSAAALAAAEPWGPVSESLQRSAIRGLYEHGDTLLQNPPREAMCLRQSPAGVREPVVVSTTETLTRGDLVLAANRQRSAGGLTVITTSRTEADRICEALAQPFWAKRDGIGLYRTSLRYWMIHDRDRDWPGIVCRRLGTDLRWVLTTAGQVAARYDGSRIATAAPGAASMPAVSDLPIIWHTNDGLVLDWPGGDADSIGSLQQLPAYDLRPVSAPVVPTRPSYLDQVTVFVATDSGRLERYLPPRPAYLPGGDWPDKPAFETFLSKYTYRTDRDPLPIKGLISRFREWLHPQTVWPVPSLQEARRTLNEIVYNGLDVEVDVVHSGDGPHYDRQWRYPMEPAGRVLPLSTGSSPLSDSIARQLAAIRRQYETHV